MHAWVMNKFVHNPVSELTNFVKGYADVYPYTKLDPMEAAMKVFHECPTEVWPVFDQALVAVLMDLQDQPVPDDLHARQAFVREVDEVMGIIRQYGLRKSLSYTQRNWNTLYDWCLDLRMSPARDPLKTLFHIMVLRID